MNLESIQALKIEGLTEEGAKKIAEASEKELEGYVTKDKYDTEAKAKEQLTKDVKARDKQLETLKGQVGDNEDLKKQIETLQKDNKTAKETYEKELKDLRINNAIKLAINSDAQDADLVATLIDKEKLVVGNDGQIVGLDEQVKALKESKSFLFKTETSTETPPTNTDPVPQFTKTNGGGAGAPNGTIYTKDQIEKMSTAEINANWEAVQNSLKNIK